MLDTKLIHERLVKSGFTDTQADGLVSVIRELASVFVTRDYLDKQMETLRKEGAELEQRLDEKRRASERRIIGFVLGGVALMLALFAFVAGLI